MASVVFLVLDMASVDPDDASLPPGVTPAKVQDGIEKSLAEMDERGWTGDVLAIEPSDAGIDKIRAQLTDHAYDCAVVGGAIRLPEGNLELFEKVINAVRVIAPDCAIAFNSSLTDMHSAAARWIDA